CGQPFDPIAQIGSCDERLFADLADWNFAVGDQLIKLRPPDRCHATALGNRVEQLLMHGGLATACRDGPGDRARTDADDGKGSPRTATVYHAKIADSLFRCPTAPRTVPSCRSILIQQPRHVPGGCADQFKTSMNETRKWAANINVIVCGTRRRPPSRLDVIERQPLHELSFRFSGRASALDRFRKPEPGLEERIASADRPGAYGRGQQSRPSLESDGTVRQRSGVSAVTGSPSRSECCGRAASGRIGAIAVRPQALPRRRAQALAPFDHSRPRLVYLVGKAGSLRPAVWGKSILFFFLEKFG